MEEALSKGDVATDAPAVAQRRWWMFGVLCLGFLMITINATLVHVALPSIRVDLQFSESSLVWVAGAYLCAYGGCLLLGGRLGDLYGHRRIFLLGILIFTLASLCCGLATSQPVLIAARALQGAAGAIVSPVALALITQLFTEVPQRAKALGICSFVGASGGSIGLVLGGALTSALSWRWSFLANVLIGACVYTLCRVLLPRTEGQGRGHVDIAGAALITSSLMVALYAIVSTNHSGFGSIQTWLLLAMAAVLLMIFLNLEARTPIPLVPLALFRIRSVVVTNVTGALLAAGVLTWNFVGTLYLQRVLQLSPMQAGWMFLPANLTIALMSLAVTPQLVVRFGFRKPLVIGTLLISGGLALLARAPVDANLASDVLPGMLLMGLGIGTAYNPMLLGALSGTGPGDTGVASGLVNATYTLGGTFGLSVLASMAAATTHHSLDAGAELSAALAAGYQRAFALGAMLAIAAAFISFLALRTASARR